MLPITLIVLILLTACGYWLLCPAESAPTQPRIILHERGTPEPDPRPIPRIIWSYWHGDTLPLVVQRCVDNWTRHCNGWQINLVNPRTFDQFVNAADLPPAFANATPARQSDWMRLYLLNRYGGVWIDASTILTRSLDWLIDAQAHSHAQYLGFYLDRYTQKPDAPIVDSWCMAAPQGSAFIRAWYQTFCDALAVGDAAYLNQLRASGQLAQIQQGIKDPAYLIIHICGQVTLTTGSGYRLQLWRAEDMAYFYQHCSHWRRLRLYRRLLIHPQAAQPPFLLKLRGGERRKLEPYLQRGWFTQRSLVGQQLMR